MNIATGTKYENKAGKICRVSSHVDGVVTYTFGARWFSKPVDEFLAVFTLWIDRNGWERS